MRLSKLRWLVVCAMMFAMTTLATAQETSQPAASDIAVPSGAPLAEGEVIILLQAKVPLELIQKFVATRGVNFLSTKETSKRILAAGGNVALVGTINLNQKDEAAPMAAIQDNGKKKK